MITLSEIDGLIAGDEIVHLNMLDVTHISPKDLLLMVKPTTVLMAKIRRCVVKEIRRH